MNKREQYIINWVKKNRTDLSVERHILPAFENEALNALMAMAFEGGRDFQTDHPTTGRARGAHEYF